MAPVSGGQVTPTRRGIGVEGSVLRAEPVETQEKPSDVVEDPDSDDLPSLGEPPGDGEGSVEQFEVTEDGDGTSFAVRATK